MTVVQDRLRQIGHPLGSPLEAGLAWQIAMDETIPLPEREYRFDPRRRWRFDFAWPARRLAVEVDGGRWVGGRHTTPRGFASDLEKLNQAAMYGWAVLRFVSEPVEDGTAVGMIRQALGLDPI